MLRPKTNVPFGNFCSAAAGIFSSFLSQSRFYMASSMYYCKLRFCQLPIADGTCSFSANKSQYLEWPVFPQIIWKRVVILIDEQGFLHWRHLAAYMAKKFTLKNSTGMGQKKTHHNGLRGYES